MRVLYAGGSICSLPTLKRLVLLADEIGFLDRPSVTFGNWGLVGHASEARRFPSDDTPINFSVYSPPSGPVGQLYERYISADLANPRFRASFLEGLQSDQTFQQRFLQLRADYGGMTGGDIVTALMQDGALVDVDLQDPVEGGLMFRVGSPEGRRETLKTLLIEASVQVTSALITSEETALVPVCDDPHFCRLLALRSADSAYVGNTARLAPYLGLAIARSVMPDELIAKLTLPELFEYRKYTRDTYRAWSTEIDRLVSTIGNVEPDATEQELKRIISSDVKPLFVQYENDLASARDSLFGSLVKKVTTWQLPTLSLAFLGGFSAPTALAAFAAALVPAIPSVTDYFVSRRELHRRNSMAYLVGVSRGLEGE